MSGPISTCSNSGWRRSALRSISKRGLRPSQRAYGRGLDAEDGRGGRELVKVMPRRVRKRFSRGPTWARTSAGAAGAHTLTLLHPFPETATKVAPSPAPRQGRTHENKHL